MININLPEYKVQTAQFEYFTNNKIAHLYLIKTYKGGPSGHFKPQRATLKHILNPSEPHQYTF